RSARQLHACRLVSATLLSAGLLFGGGCAICEDVDGDGKPDVVAGLDNKVLIYQNTSSPGKLNEFSFAPAVEFAALTALDVRVGINSVLAGDFDGDGKVDLVVVAYSEGVLAVFLNTSTVGRIDGNSFATPVHFS